MAAFISEQFPTASRYTGASVVYQVGSIVGGFAPMIAATFYAQGQDTNGASIFLMAICAISLIAVWRSAETRNRDISQ